MARTLSFSKAINEALAQAMREDETIILLGEDLAGGHGVAHLEGKGAWGGVMGVTKGLVEEFGEERVIDTPISEMGYMGAAVGAAATGMHPVPELMFNDFLGFCLDPLLGQGSKMRYMFGGKASLPLTVRTTHGAGASAAAQHSGTYYGMLAAIPGIKVVVPSTPYTAKGLLLAALKEPNIVVFSEDKTLYSSKGEVPEEQYTLEIGKAEVVQEGADLTIVTIGKMLFVGLEVAEQLKASGISTEVIDLLTVSPWDRETLEASIQKTGRMIIIDEANPHNSVGRDIAAVISDVAFDYLDAPIKVVSAPDTPVPFASNLEKLYIPSAQRVLSEADELIFDLRSAKEA
ncbi:alpha-ketoacid dehydrogenase subunit beta [Carnimonas nigrificans]|uniref:alpha-ketoacid dehydrogenase subunit beta n=1 Tax=Carnimonas nigrificans TaxID=64323 RepID=UPI00046F4C9D|nr:alpha-ketoacid dehydrogenase subunit beta [Carnimonas nigrificans]